MRHFTFVAAMILTAPAAAQTTAFVGVTVVPADRERVIENQTVIVRDRIVAMGPAAKIAVPPEAVRIDGAGKFLMPGIAEMHAHLPDDHQLPEAAEQMLALLVANGVTTARGVQGAPNQPALRDRVARGELLGPRLFVYGPALDGSTVKTPEDGVRLVGEYHRAGYDGLKIHEGLNLATYQAIVREAKKLKMPFAGHVPNEVGLRRALAAGQKSIEHLDGFLEALGGDDVAAEGPGRTQVSVTSYVALGSVDEKKLADLVAATKRAGAVVTPTMAIWRTLFGDLDLAALRQLPELQYLDPRQAEGSLKYGEARLKKLPPAEALQKLARLRNATLAALAKAHLVVMGSDAPQVFSVPGFSLRHETEAMVKAGLTPWQVVEAGTVAVARYFGVEKDSGTVAVGKRADLILADANPLADVANIFRTSGVMVNGRWLPRAELDAKLAEIARGLRYPSAAEIKDLPIPTAEAAALTGSYSFKGDKISVALVNGALMLTAHDPKGDRTLRLRSQGGGVYLMPEVKAKVSFELRDGRAVALIANQGGGQIKALRIAP
jgi:imidazolonepropionase-like amidohydrolase